MDKYYFFYQLYRQRQQRLQRKKSHEELQLRQINNMPQNTENIADGNVNNGVNNANNGVNNGINKNKLNSRFDLASTFYTLFS